jgi:hypothetical protein
MPTLSLCIVGATLSISLPASNSVPEVVGDNPSLQEILWNFNRFKDSKKCLTLRENPHFYAKLPTLSDAYGSNFRLSHTEDFRYANEFYVLTDRPRPVHILADGVLKTFGNFWCPENAVIFQCLSILFYFIFYVFDVLSDIDGGLAGESIIKTYHDHRDRSCKLCMTLWRRESTVPGIHRAWQQIIARGCSQMAPRGCLIGDSQMVFQECLIDYPRIVPRKCLTDYFPTNDPVMFGVCICTRQGAAAPNIPVRCDIITYLTVC